MQSLFVFKRIALTFIGIVLLQTAFCQENYLPGYIIRLNGDTIKGFIDYRNWETNPDKISFKEKLSSDKAVYTANDIMQFNVKDESYESALIETEVSPEKLNELETNNTLNFESEVAFLQTMIKGSKSLYYYKSKMGKDQFYIKHDTGYELLTYKKYLVSQNGGSAVAENKKYLGQLSLYLSDCLIIQTKLKNTEYNKATLLKLFHFYYDYTHTGIKFLKEAEKIKTEFGLLGGLSTTSLKFKSGSVAFNYLTNTIYTTATNFEAGLFLNVVIPRNNGKLSIYNELNLSFYNVKGQYDEYDPLAPVDKNTHTFTNFGYSYLKMINMLRYKYPIGFVSVFMGIGMSNGFAISSTNYERFESTFYGTHTVVESKAIKNSRNYEQGLVFDLGSDFKIFTVQFRLEKGNGMSNEGPLNSTTTRYSFLFGFKF